MPSISIAARSAGAARLPPPWRRRSVAGSSSSLATVASKPCPRPTGKANGARPFPAASSHVTWDNGWLLCSNDAGDLAALRASDGELVWRVYSELHSSCRPRRARSCVRGAGWRAPALDRPRDRTGLVVARAAGPHYRGQGRRRAADCRHHRQRGVQPGPRVGPSTLAMARRRRRRGPGRERRPPYLLCRARQRPPGRGCEERQPPLDHRTALATGRRASGTGREGRRAALEYGRHLRSADGESRSPDHRRRRDELRPARARRRPHHLAAAGGHHARRPHAGLRLALRGPARATPGAAGADRAAALRAKKDPKTPGSQDLRPPGLHPAPDP